MSETFSGIVSINTTNSDELTIRLNGDTGDVRLGGPGRDGDLTLRDGAGQARIELRGSANSITFRNRSGEIVATLGSSGNLRLGGEGMDGDITVRDDQDKVRLRFNGDTQRLAIFQPTGERVVELGPNGNLTLGGGGGADGDITLKDANGVDRIALDAQSHRMILRDAASHEFARLGDFGNLKLGSGGHDGDILLYPSSAPDMSTFAAATIHLDADAGDIVLRNADFAEDFDIDPSSAAPPGTVMSLSEDGTGLRPSRVAHDGAVVGVVSNGGAYKPGIVLDRQPETTGRQPIALAGKVYVRVTDENGRIAAGDLLTSSSTPGTAMRASDPVRSFGAVIGKALAPHECGEGMIPMVSALQ